MSPVSLRPGRTGGRCRRRGGWGRSRPARPPSGERGLKGGRERGTGSGAAMVDPCWPTQAWTRRSDAVEPLRRVVLAHHRRRRRPVRRRPQLSRPGRRRGSGGARCGPAEGGRTTVVRRRPTAPDGRPAGALDRPDPGARVRRPGLLPCPRRRSRVRQLRRPAALPACARRPSPARSRPSPTSPAACATRDRSRPRRGRGPVRPGGARRRPGQPLIVSVPLDGAATTAALAGRGGSDFVACPAVVPGRPTDRLHLLGPPADAVGRHRAAGRRPRLAGGRRPAEQAQGRPGRVGARSRSGPGRAQPLRRLRPVRLVEPLPGRDHGAPEALCAREEEFGWPLWQLGYSSYARAGRWELAVLHGPGTFGSACSTPPPAS